MPALLLKAKAVETLDESEKAIEQYERVKEIMFEAYKGSATCLLFLKRFEEALHEVETCVYMAPEETQFHNKAAILLVLIKQDQQAINHVKRGLRHVPHDAYAYQITRETKCRSKALRRCVGRRQ